MNQVNIFAERRQVLMRAIRRDSVAVIASAPVSVRNRDVEYPYRQNSDFFYLTGFAEPEAVAVLAPGRKEGEFVLFCREYDPQMAIWTGSHAGLDGARERFGADQAFPIGQFSERLPEFLQNRRRVVYPLGRSAALDGAVTVALNAVRGKARAGIEAPREFVDLESFVHEVRLLKSPVELAAMERATCVSAAAHCRAMRICRPGMLEYQIEAELLHEFASHGLRATAYPAIVAGGANACVLHYTENSEVLRDGDLLLIDAGAECDHYAADITRTFPVNGRFSAPQRAVYDVVLRAQLAAIDAVRPGHRWNQPHDVAVEELVKGLVELGILAGDPARLIRKGAYKPYYMHRTGHWLGMDVHDVGAYRVGGRWRELKPGMVLTVEPGLYFALDADVEACWRGIGIRIEDDVLVTESGCHVLTSGVPKAIDEIEQLMAESR